jgi:hypothetical protein
LDESFTVYMIKREVDDSPFNATEDYLLVPVPAGTQELPTGGFAAQVLERFPVGRRTFERRLGRSALDAGEVWTAHSVMKSQASYFLAFAAIHLPEARGWKDAPQYLEQALADLPRRNSFVYDLHNRPISVATAGIPGTGYSGLRGDADPEAMRAALEATEREIHIYRREESFVREPRAATEPLQSDSVRADIPA